MKKILFLFLAVCATAIATATGCVPFSPTEVLGVGIASSFPLAATAEQYRKFYRAINLVSKRFGFLAAPGHLRSEVAVANGASVYQFPIRDIQMTKTTFPQSKGVQDNDLFVTFSQAIFWDNRTSGQGNIQLQSYPNDTVATAVGITTNQLYAFYSGLFNVQVGSTEFIKQFDSAGFLTIPDAQQSSSSDRSAFDIAAVTKVIGAYPVYSGKADNKVTLTINPTGITDVVGDSGQTVLTYFSQGVIINNGTNDPKLYSAVLEVLESLGQ